MKTRIFLFLLCLTSLSVMGQGTIKREKCKTCGKVVSQCPYNGNHPIPTPKPTPQPQPTPKPNPKPIPEAAGYDVTFSCNVPTAKLFIDGSANGNASGTHFLKTGNHNIKATANGYDDYSSNITVNRRNTSFAISMTKKSEPIPTPEAAGYDVTFTCNVPTAKLFIDGDTYTNASDTHFIKTGNHNIKLTADGYEDYSKDITVNRQNTSFSIVMEKLPEPEKPLMVTTGTENGREWVDLGLSVKWATCNVGAHSPEEYGGYYAWGETSTKSKYDWDNCFDCIKPSKWDKKNSWEIYKKGGQTCITPSSGHDTARENWGGTWRMPTEAELKELCDKCKWTWTSKNGHNGYTVTGPNGNSIFLPAAGWRFGADTRHVGEDGYYWSSTLSTSGSKFARGLGFDSGSHYTNYVGGRSNGQSVRPVTE